MSELQPSQSDRPMKELSEREQWHERLRHAGVARAEIRWLLRNGWQTIPLYDALEDLDRLTSAAASRIADNA